MESHESSVSRREAGRAVLTRTHYWYQHEPCWYVRKKNAPWFRPASHKSPLFRTFALCRSGLKNNSIGPSELNKTTA
jgi:hypothetical protein